MSSQLPLCYCLLTLLLAGIRLAQSATPEATTVTSSTQEGNPSTQQPTTANSVNTDHNLYWIIQHAENPSGMANGQPCSSFSFAGEQCTMTFSYKLITDPLDNLSNELTTLFGYGNSVDNHELRQTALAGNVFNGFTISGSLKNGDQTIATFSTYQVTADLTKGIHTLSDPVSGASVRIAWKTSLPQATTTPIPTTTQYQSTTSVGPTISGPTGTPGSPATQGTPQSTQSTTVGSTTVPLIANDCDDYTEDRNNGVKTIYIGGTPIQVYCEFGASGALTTIQSRGERDNTVFNNTLDAYKTPIGTAGKGNNFWLGLDNMHNITNGNVSYNLYIEVCCGTASIQRQRYHSFVIGSLPNYTLNAIADVPGTGLDIVALGNTGVADIGANFNTILTYNKTGRDVDDCEVLAHWNDPDFTKVDGWGSGGWWFGSCANNLNGKYIGSASGLNSNCSVLDFTTDAGPGIELRTSTGQTDQVENLWMDGKSYTRVRMAIFRNDVQLQGISSEDFCS